MELTMDSFFPDGTIHCEADLPFEDGTYEVWNHKLFENVLFIFEIRNHRITHYYHYNIKQKKRVITWTFEYLTDENGKPIHNIWRQAPGTQERDMYHSTHWHLYPEHQKKRMEHDKFAKQSWNNFINSIYERQAPLRNYVETNNVEANEVKAS